MERRLPDGNSQISAPIRSGAKRPSLFVAVSDRLRDVEWLQPVTLLVREVLGCLVILIFLNGVLFSLVEGKDLGSSIYFAFITGLTIGYGDITPVTTLGRIVAVFFTGFCGTIFVGLIVAINTRALRQTVKEMQEKDSA